jgi:hypothetical protein
MVNLGGGFGTGPSERISTTLQQPVRRLGEQLAEWRIGQSLEFEKPCARCRGVTQHKVRGYMSFGSICEAVCVVCGYKYKFRVIGNDFSAPLEYVGDDGKWHSPDGRW